MSDSIAVTVPCRPDWGRMDPADVDAGDVDPGDVDATNVEVFEVSSPGECAQLAQVLADVWGFSESSAVASPDTLRAMAYSGSYLVGARLGGRLIGGGFGWPTYVDGEWRLHSHVVGFLDGYRALGLGARVKHHQRDWVRTNGLDAIEWTFDPLHAANARFNLAKLGASVVAFHNDFYGTLEDEFSAGLGSDRFVVRWGLDDEPRSLVEGSPRESILRVGHGGAPVATSADSARLIAEIPRNIVEIRKTDTIRAIEWRDAFAATVGQVLIDGATVVGITPDCAYLINR